jgi:hypothetical protein
MQVYNLNREIFDLPVTHPACRFLCAFMECRCECIGLEASEDPIDQEWFSQSEGEVWSYSNFAYMYLAFDIVLDGWLTHASQRTRTEQHSLNQLPHWRELLHECKEAAKEDNNNRMILIIKKVLRMFDLWEQCIIARDTATDDMYPRKANRNLYPIQKED